MRPLPRLWRPVGTARLELQLPARRGNRAWLRTVLGAGARPQLDTDRWRIARSHLQHLVDEVPERFGALELFLDFRTTERCDTRCQRARGDDCTCSCMGANHGGSQYWKQWRLVSETTLVMPTGLKRRRMVIAS